MQGFPAPNRSGPTTATFRHRLPMGTDAVRAVLSAVRAAGLAGAMLAAPAVAQGQIAPAAPAIENSRGGAAAQPAQQPTFPSGSRIGIVPPQGMTPSRAFLGFEDATLHVTLEISELAPQSYSQVARQFTPDMLALHGTEILVQENVTLRDGSGLLIAGRPTGGAPPVTRWSMLAHLGEVIAVVTLLVPDTARDAYPEAAIRRTFETLAARGRPSDEEMLSLLPFRLGELAGFRILRARPDGTVMLTSGPADTPLPIQQPFLLVALRGGETPSADERETAARRALGQIMGLDRVTVTDTGPVRFANRQGHEIRGQTRDMKEGTPLSLVHWIAFGPNMHLQLYGIARTDEWDAVLPRMRAIRDGIQPK